MPKSRSRTSMAARALLSASCKLPSELCTSPRLSKVAATCELSSSYGASLWHYRSAPDERQDRGAALSGMGAGSLRGLSKDSRTPRMEPRSCHIARAEHRNAGGVPLGQEMMASDHGKQEAARQGAHKAPTRCCLYPKAFGHRQLLRLMHIRVHRHRHRHRHTPQCCLGRTSAA